MKKTTTRNLTKKINKINKNKLIKISHISVNILGLFITHVTKLLNLLQVDGLRKVYEIFTSLSVDPGVKKSAVDQLAIILQGKIVVKYIHYIIIYHFSEYLLQFIVSSILYVHI